MSTAWSTLQENTLQAERIPNKQISVGLTGGIGSGKTTVANFFADLGVSVIDTDAIAHKLTSAGGTAIESIREEFGAKFIAEDGSMDRQKMRTLVFSDMNAKQRLEHILHPRIRDACDEAALTATSDYVIFVVPLLIESGTWRDRVKRVLVIDCDEETQIDRVMHRNQFSRDQVCRIMRTQVSRQTRLKYADDIINSQQELGQLKQQVELLHQKYLQMCAQG